MPLKTLFKAFLVFTHFCFLGGIKNSSISYPSNISKVKIDQVNNVSSQCPDEHPKARELLESYLTDHELSERRIQTDTDGLTVDQINLLTDSNADERQICSELRSIPEYNPANFGDTVAAVYYKVGGYYFVSMPIIKTTTTFEGKEVVIMGSDAIAIFDSSLNKLYEFGL